MSGAPDRTCLDCKYWLVMESTPDYSEVTPGSDGSWECTKGHWYMCNLEDSQKEARAKLLQARTCRDFTLADFAV